MCTSKCERTGVIKRPCVPEHRTALSGGNCSLAQCLHYKCHDPVILYSLCPKKIVPRTVQLPFCKKNLALSNNYKITPVSFLRPHPIPRASPPTCASHRRVGDQRLRPPARPPRTCASTAHLRPRPGPPPSLTAATEATCCCFPPAPPPRPPICPSAPPPRPPHLLRPPAAGAHLLRARAPPTAT